jgi:predicted phage baseplate assembly protein
MPLTPTILDDLGWAEQVAAIRQRIPAASRGRWTLHSPVDPGVTLLELLAYLLDLRLYWMDQVPLPFLRAVLGLLGEAMRGPQAAATVLQLLEAPGPVVAAGTELELADAPDGGPVFSTAEALAVLPVKAVGVRALGVDRSDDLRQGRGVALLAADGAPGEAALILWLAGPPPAGAGRALSLLLELDSTVEPEWAPSAPAQVAPPAALGWWYSGGPGLPPRPFAGGAVRDGTGGLRRSGLVRLPVPADWAPAAPPSPATGWAPYQLLLRTAAARHTSPPRLVALSANAVLARHLRRAGRRASLDPAGWLPLPGLELDLQLPALAPAPVPPVPRTVQLRLRERDGRWHRWSPVEDFARLGPGDRCFAVDRDRGVLRFGDGLNGRIPRLASGPNLGLRLSAGAGAAGNVGSACPFVDTAGAGLRARSLVPADGGSDAETADQARERVGRALRRVERAVTAPDFELLATTTPGVAVARAHAAVGFHPDHPCLPVPGAVTVFLVPFAPRGDAVPGAERVAAPRPDPGALETVAARLEEARLVGTELFVRPPVYRQVRLGVRLAAAGAGDPSPADAVAEALRRHLDPLEGGTDGGGWPFGEPLRPSGLMRAAEAVLDGGVEVVAVAIGLDGAPPTEDCHDVPLGAHELPAVSEIAVRNDPAGEQSGGLR